MVAPSKNRRVVCQAVVATDAFGLGGDRYKPSALVPWADPYIAGLVRRLQSEVRFARAEAADYEPSHLETCSTSGSVSVRRLSAPKADLDPPSPSVDSDWDGWDAPRWSSDWETQ
jgi:hypothetical protein